MAKKRGTKQNGQPLGFEQTLCAAADKLRGNLESAEYKHVMLGLIFLKYVSDAFEERHQFLLAATADSDSDYYGRNEQVRGEIVKSRDEYTAEGVFWVPAEARWSAFQAAAKQADIGQRIDRAMDAIEAENPSLKGVLPKKYARPATDRVRAGCVRTHGQPHEALPVDERQVSRDELVVERFAGNGGEFAQR